MADTVKPVHSKDHEERIAALEEWARGAHSTPFMPTTPPEKVTAFFKRPDGKIEEHTMFLIDYTAAEKQAPDSWTTDVPGPGVEVLTEPARPAHEKDKELKPHR